MEENQQPAETTVSNAKIEAFAALSQLAGLAVRRAGSMIVFPGSGSIDVAPQCNGVRSAITMLMLSIIYVYLSRARWYSKAAVVAAAIPINLVRLFGIVSGAHLLGERFMEHEQAFDHAFGLSVFCGCVWCSFSEHGLLNAEPSWKLLSCTHLLVAGDLDQAKLPRRFRQRSASAEETLAALPYRVGGYTSREAHAADIRGYPGELHRIYAPAQGNSIELLTFSTPVNVHGPENCLPYMGGSLIDRERRNLHADPAIELQTVVAASDDPSEHPLVCGYYWRRDRRASSNLFVTWLQQRWATLTMGNSARRPTVVINFLKISKWIG